MWYYVVLIPISRGYPSVKGRLHTRYAPVRRSCIPINRDLTPRLACIRPAASVHPEPGSNSSLYICLSFFSKENLYLSRSWQKKINSKIVFLFKKQGCCVLLYLAWLHYVYELFRLKSENL